MTRDICPRCSATSHLWAYVDLNHGPLPCQGSALPLSYTPEAIEYMRL
jgi:hypothetical protein